MHGAERVSDLVEKQRERLVPLAIGVELLASALVEIGQRTRQCLELRRVVGRADRESRRTLSISLK